MQQISIGPTALKSSRLVYGCMRICGDGSPKALNAGKAAVRAAVDAGFNHFDHADIYADGACESLFGEVLRESPGLRNELILTGKCGIQMHDPKRYDFSSEHILRQVEGSLKRLGVEALDLLLLHRPDYLMDADEVAGTFDRLQSEGKVKHFGVSNFSPTQLDLLQSRWKEPLVVNQVEINIHRVAALEDGTLDQCQQRRIRPMAWCPLGGVVYPAWGNTFTPDDEQRVLAEVARQAEAYGVEDWILILAWLLKHPAVILPIVGSTTPERIRAAPTALGVDYSREDWYRLLEARRGEPLP